jgi:hypothetical protein
MNSRPPLVASVALLFSASSLWALVARAMGPDGGTDASTTTATNAAVEAAVTGLADCPDDSSPIDRAGHCCLPGQRWGAGRCEGAPTACPPGRVLGREDGGVTCVLRACEPPMQRAADGVHCCYAGQTFNAREQRCTGATECPDGTERAGRGECVPAQRVGSARPSGPRSGMQWIPGGVFEMGPRGGGRIVQLSPYWIDRTEVTASEFERCVRRASARR